ncbi:MAG: hypothetical protein H6581_18000 [Bacteroidia bacterium]|nr:hypothetical protein [Bacteroidia bacterium]
MKLKAKIQGVFYSLPIQLVMMQMRNHKSILIFWFFLFLTITNNFGTTFGIPYLFLEPEYLGRVSFWSMYLIGLGIGTFIVSYHIATYILDSYRFSFLALKKMPFFIFVVNNSLIPLTFTAIYLFKVWQFALYSNGGYSNAIIWLMLGCISGLISILLLVAIYLNYTNKDIEKLFDKAMVHEFRRPKVILHKARESLNLRYRVDYFLNHRLRFEPVDKTIPVQFRSMVKILNQNHGNALFLESLLLAIIVGLGLVEKNPYFQIPSGLSILLICSMVLMLTAAFTFWFRKIGLLTILIAGSAFFVLDRMGILDGIHPAYGMNYEAEPAQYTAENLLELSSDKYWEMDFAETEAILDHWKSNYQIIHGQNRKPRAVIIMTSGGGLRATYFSMRSLQIMDSLTQGRLWDRTRLITGASGGMVGAGIYRELALQRRLNQQTHINSLSWANKASRDLLNRISFKIVTGIFLPGMKEKVGTLKYPSDRGFSFDDQLIHNLGILKNKRLGDYVDLEYNAVVPMMVFSPLIVNDGRKLLVSSTPVSYLSRPEKEIVSAGAGISGIDFRRFFRKQDADSLLFVTAMRMNASFPLITPYIELPSNPPLEVIDAGVVDNYGVNIAVKFLRVFKDWFRENTDGVLLVQIRDSERSLVDQEFTQKSLLGKVLDPVGAAYQSFSASKDVATYENFSYMEDWYEGNIEMIAIEYIHRDPSQARAALSWHLTEKEKEHIENSLESPENLEKFEAIRDWIEAGENNFASE